ncbi:FtsK/SpoIIIE domain-containing protein [Lentzea sp. NPDC005914]|uniref:FtsK/SpoIIIE domain-containing protein n=1 Tax=Lentzea sp. NPDC005914 TaxID=3154572 RepID=UPI003406DB31
MIRNFAVVGPGQATRERLTAALAAAPDMAVYRIGRGADPLPVSATFDPSDQAGCRSLLDWFERGAPSGAVLLLDDWGLCFEQDPELDQVVEWIAAFGPARGVQVVVTARKWSELPVRLRRHLDGEATDFLALHGIEADLSDKYQRHDLKAAVGVDERGWPVYLDISVDGNGLTGAYYGPQRGQKLLSALLGLMITHSPQDLNLGLIDMKNSRVFDSLNPAPHVSFALKGEDQDELFERFQVGLEGELNRRQELMHKAGCRNFTDYGAQAGVEPLASLLICVDSAEVLIERLPRFADTLKALTSAGRIRGIHLLYSGDAFPQQLPYNVPEWPFATPPHDIEEWIEALPWALAGSAPPARPVVLPALHQNYVELKLDMLPPGAIGVVDEPYLQRRDVLVPTFTDQLRHGAIVGKPGTGKSTTLRTLATVLGDLTEYQLLDGPGEPLDPERHIVVTARSWDQVPPFIRNSLAFAVEFRLDDPATSLVDARQAARVPDQPGYGLSVPHRLHAQIALP